MKKIIFVIIPVLLLAACTKDISRFNQETKKPAIVAAGPLFANGVKNLADAYGAASVNTNVFRFTVKHWAMAVYQEEAQFDFATRNIPQSWWLVLYRDVLNDLNEAARIINEDASIQPAVKANQLAVVDIMQVYVYNILVNTFGDVPYSEAFNAAVLFPKYDDAKTIQTDLLKRLTTDISKLTAASGGFAAADDLMYKGSTAKWMKFANSLRMKIGMTISDVDDASAKAAVEASNANAMSSSADDGALIYISGTSPSVVNPLYNDIVLGGRSDYVAAKDLLDTLVALADPRKPLYFGTNNAGQYVGGIVGKTNTFSDMSKPNTKVYAADAPVVLLDYVETEFYRAEAKERGYNVTGSASEHYNNAITASITSWGGTAADASAYLAKPEVAYATAPGAFKQKIGFQKWIALYNRPFEGWTEVRRLDFPKLTLPVAARSGYPNRLSYPSNEQQLNGANYTSAAAKIGTDKVETKLYWDKF
jgi:hypothetical protein